MKTKEEIEKSKEEYIEKFAKINGLSIEAAKELKIVKIVCEDYEKCEL